MLEILLLSSHAFTAALLGMADFMGWMQAQTHTVGAVLRKYKKNFSVKVDMASIHQFFKLLIQFKLAGGMELIPAVVERKARNILDRLAVFHRAMVDTECLSTKTPLNINVLLLSQKY